MFTGTQPHLMALYNRWMNQRLYAACATLTDAQRREDLGLFFKSIDATLEHLIWADTAWMTRFEGLPVGAPPTGGPPQRPFQELTAARVALDERIALPRPRSRGNAAFAALEERVLQRVLREPGSEAPPPPESKVYPIEAWRWSV